MTLWRLELLRLARTNRWAILAGVYLFFGALGPVTARYFADIMGRFGGEIEFTIPDPTPIDGLVQYLGNASQLGILAVVVVAAAALAVDARPEAAAFYRTRIQDARTILVPRYVVTTAAGVLAYVAGTLVAWAGTAALIGPLPTTEMLAGTVLGSLYLAFLVAVVAAVASVTRGVVTTVFASLAVAIALPVLGFVRPIAPWLPSELVGAPTDVVAGAPVTGFWQATVVAAVATVALLALAAHRQTHREL